MVMILIMIWMLMIVIMIKNDHFSDGDGVDNYVFGNDVDDDDVKYSDGGDDVDNDYGV